jgi:ATP-dependent Clp protease ATP-binding subunit ClpB
LLKARGLSLELTGAAIQRLADLGFDPVYGARPLKRAIQTNLQDALALKLLDGSFVDGDTIRADVQGGEMVFEKV